MENSLKEKEIGNKNFPKRKNLIAKYKLRSPSAENNVEKYEKSKIKFISEKSTKKIEDNNSEVIIHILFKGKKFKIFGNLDYDFKQIKLFLFKFLGIFKKEDVIFLYLGKVIFDENKNLRFYKIINNSELIIIPSGFGGNRLRLTSNNDISMDLFCSLDFFENKEDLEKLKFICEKKKEEFIKKYKNIKNAIFPNSDELMAILIWTSDLLYNSVNLSLRNNENPERWSIFINNIIRGIKYFPYYKGKIYRGFKDYKNLEVYKKGEIICWKNIISFSKLESIAREKFSNNEGMIFELESISSRDISSISLNKEEKEILLLPYSCFEIMEVIDEKNKPTYVKLKEIPLPFSPNIIFWVDDDPRRNYSLAFKLEMEGKSILFCVSTEDALRLIHNCSYLLHFGKSNFKIITDMVRVENGVINYYAGIDLLKELFNEYEYKYEVMIYCSDVISARKNCEKHEIFGKFRISNKENELLFFLRN